MRYVTWIELSVRRAYAAAAAAADGRGEVRAGDSAYSVALVQHVDCEIFRRVSGHGVVFPAKLYKVLQVLYNIMWV